MDERELETLFRSAPGDPPSPTFGVDEIADASRRATARHRMRVATASSLAAVVIAGGGLFAAFGPLSGDDEAPTAAGAGTQTGQREQPQDGAGRQESGDTREGGPSMQGDEQLDRQEPGLSSTDECKQVDRELAIALAGELPATASDEDDPVPGAGPCPPGTKRAGYQVEDGDAAGTVAVSVIPKGKAVRFVPSEGSKSAEARAASGATVYVISTPSDTGEPPFADDLRAIADAIADRY